MHTFKTEQRENPREGSEHVNKQKIPKRKTKIKMGTTGYGKYAERRTWEETEEEKEEDLWKAEIP
jgi:hypothetical protein